MADFGQAGGELPPIPGRPLSDASVRGLSSESDRLICRAQMIDIIETVYRGASKGRGLVVAPKGELGHIQIACRVARRPSFADLFRSSLQTTPQGTNTKLFQEPARPRPETVSHPHGLHSVVVSQRGARLR